MKKERTLDEKLSIITRALKKLINEQEFLMRLTTRLASEHMDKATFLKALEETSQLMKDEGKTPPKTPGEREKAAKDVVDEFLSRWT